LVEARIDFSDEGDVPEDLVAPALGISQGLRNEISEALAGAARGERLREGMVVAIAGPPNVGKSTLFNRLARREAAIVSAIPGTTRDVIEVHLDLGGYPVTVLDTAGIRVSNDPVEQEGILRAQQRAADADLVLWVVDPDAMTSGQAVNIALGRVPIWMVRNKADLAGRNESRFCKNESVFLFERYFFVSAALGEGVNQLIGALTEYAIRFFGAETALVTRERHRKALEDVLAALDRGLAGNLVGREEVIAEELRLAARALGRLTGRVDVEDILDVIFRDFCIGK
jgi:tRNA modification GTPase